MVPNRVQEVQVEAKSSQIEPKSCQSEPKMRPRSIFLHIFGVFFALLRFLVRFGEAKRDPRGAQEGSAEALGCLLGASWEPFVSILEAFGAVVRLFWSSEGVFAAIC